MELFLLATGLALGISFVCSMLEATVLSLTPAQIATMETKSPGAAAIWRRFKVAIDRPIAVILVLNTTAHTIGATIAGSEFSRIFGTDSLLIFSLLFTLVMLQFTEVLPKSLGVRYNRALAPLIARPLAWMMRLLAPLLAVIHWINKPFQSRPNESDVQQATLEELAATARLARATQQIGDREHRIITGAAQLQRQTVEEAMIPRSSVTAISTTMTPRQALTHVRNDPHILLPLIQDNNFDLVLGQITFEDLVFRCQDHPDDGHFTDLTQPLMRVPLTHPLNTLLDAFAASGDAMALVVAEDGHTLGVVTLSDVLSELLGDMGTDDADLPRSCVPYKGGWLVGGSLSISELAQRMGVSWADANGTVDAWLQSRFGDLLHVGRIWSEGDIRFRIRRLRHGRIAEVEVIPASGR